MFLLELHVKNILWMIDLMVDDASKPRTDIFRISFGALKTDRLQCVSRKLLQLQHSLLHFICINSTPRFKKKKLKNTPGNKN